MRGSVGRAFLRLRWHCFQAGDGRVSESKSLVGEIGATVLVFGERFPVHLLDILVQAWSIRHELAGVLPELGWIGEGSIGEICVLAVHVDLFQNESARIKFEPETS